MRTDMHGVIERINATMHDAANDAHESSPLRDAWCLVPQDHPTPDKVPDDAGYWWQNQLLDASRRAFDHKSLGASIRRGSLDAGGLPIDGVVWNNGPCVYRNQEIRVELRRQTQGAPWSARVTISTIRAVRVNSRMFFAGIPSTVAGAVGAYALVIEEAKREIDRQDVPFA